MHIIRTCEIVISAGFHGAIVLRPFCTKYRLYGRMQKVYESIPFYVSFMTLHFPLRSSNFADIYGPSSFFDIHWPQYMSMKIQAPFRQSKNPSGKRGMYTFVYWGTKVLKFDRPLDGGFLSLTAPNGQSIKRKALLWAGYGPTSTDLHILCRMCTARGLWWAPFK